MSNSNISILGAGSFGTALAVLLAAKGFNIKIWDVNEEVVGEINEAHTNKRAVPECQLSENIQASTEIGFVLQQAAFISMVLPTQVIGPVLTANKEAFKESVPLICCSKGIDIKELQTLDEIIPSRLPHFKKNLFYLSGPSFAREIVDERPTCVCLAGPDDAKLKEIQILLSNDYFRVYISDDVKGVEIAGALKNIIAIGSGMIDGLQLGKNAESAYITRGLAEISRFGAFFGANPLTFLGLAGIGDLVLTCTGSLSRNRTFGYRLAKGEDKESILQNMGHVVEGVSTLEAVYQLSKTHKIEMPITDCLYKVLQGELSIKDTVASLMGRGLKYEHQFDV